MRDNYQSFLNVIFSVNRFLNDCLIPAKTRSELPPERREEYVKALSRVYPSRDQDSSTKYYYKHAIEKVAEKIGLYSSIEELKKE